MSIYRKDVRHLDELDLYVLADLYDVKSHAVFHAIKKLICAGKRGAKDYEQDLMEAIESIERELQMMPVPVEEEPREVGGVQECGFKPMHHEGLIPVEDLDPDWDRRHPSLRFAVRDENGKFVFCKDQPSSGTFWIRPADFDEQRIDAIWQNGGEPHYDDWRMAVDWSLASPHHMYAFLGPTGIISFSMYQPMGYDYIGRPSAQ